MEYYYTQHRGPSWGQIVIKRILRAAVVFSVVFVVVDLTVGPKLTEIIKEQTMVVVAKDPSANMISLQPVTSIEGTVTGLKSTVTDAVDSIEQLQLLLTEEYQTLLDSLSVGDKVEVKQKERTSTLLGVKTGEDVELLSTQRDK